MPTQNTENNYIENWVKSNETRLTEIRNGNPELYGAVNGVLNYINNYLGNTNPIQEIVSKETLIPATPETVALNEDNWKDFDFFNTKIYVNTPEKSDKFQRLIFDLGGKWNGYGTSVRLTDKLFLFIDDKLNLQFTNDRNYFDNTPVKEIFYDDIFPISTGVKQADTLKVGDKVKLPKTRRGKTDNSNVIKNALIRNQDFLYVTDVVKNRVYLSFDNSDANEEAFVLDQDKIELYEAPEPKFKIGDRVVRINGKQVMTVVKQLYDVKQKMFDYDLVFEDGTDVSLFENQLEAISTQSSTELDPNNFQWEQIWGSGLTPETIVSKYKEYVKSKGKIDPYDVEQLVESFGKLSVIVDTYSNTKNYDEAYNYILSKQPSSSKERWNIFRFDLKPEFEGIFKNFKKLTDTFKMGNALIFKVENRTKFNQFLEAILREDLLYNSLTIPDLILGKKTNSITVTQQEQADFDDLLDELDNLEL